MSGLEKVVFVLRVLGDEEVTQGLVDFLVDNKGIGLFGLGLGDLDGVAGFQVFQVGHFEFQEVSCPDSVVYPKGKKQEVSGPVREKGFDGLNIFHILDGVDEYLCAFLGMVRIFHCKLP